VLGTSTYPAGSIPYGLAVDPINALVYAANYYDANIVGYTIDATPAAGQLTAITGPPASPFPFQAGLPTNQPYALAVYPKGGFLYVTDSIANSVDEYSYGANGALGQWIIYEVGAAPKGVTIDPTGSFLYVANSGDGTVSAFTINATTGERLPPQVPRARTHPRRSRSIRQASLPMWPTATPARSRSSLSI
jgi:6-phosphogluconolactonase